MQNNDIVYHVPVLLNECLKGLDIKPDGVYVDVTFGGGGHSKEIVKQLDAEGHLYSFDQDLDAAKNILNDDRFTFVRSNFRYLENFMRYHDVDGIDGLLADLGVSSHHFDDETRGFSFRFDSKLDMRMNQRATNSATEILNNYSEEQLADIFYFYGEMKNARKIASVICKARSLEKIETTEQFLAIIRPCINKMKEKKELAQVFQALRIEVNDELAALKEMLIQAEELLNKGGRLVVITYHSLEDRLVKNFMKTGNFEGKVEKDFFGNTSAKLKPFKMIIPSDEEIERNPRARSAKLRIAEKIVL
ncbi:MAG: 16S rRNA (cytosine(1402)-N(4))-methyltransferase RsmH [Bacteroidales bacterium]